jgi:hypothetical protein
MDSTSTWSPPQFSILLNQIPHPWTFLCSYLIYSDLDSALLRRKVLTPLWTRTPFQFGPASSIFFLSLPRQLTWSSPECLIRSHQCLSGLICSYPVELLYPIGLLLTRSYPATLPNFLTQSFPDETSNYPIVPGHLTQLPYPAGLPSDAHSVKPSSTVYHFVVYTSIIMMSSMACVIVWEMWSSIRWDVSWPCVGRCYGFSKGWNGGDD